MIRKKILFLLFLVIFPLPALANYNTGGYPFFDCGTAVVKMISINKNLDNIVLGKMFTYLKRPDGFREKLIHDLVSHGADEDKASIEVYQTLKDIIK